MKTLTETSAAKLLLSGSAGCRSWNICCGRLASRCGPDAQFSAAIISAASPDLAAHRVLNSLACLGTLPDTVDNVDNVKSEAP